MSNNKVIAKEFVEKNYIHKDTIRAFRENQLELLKNIKIPNQDVIGTAMIQQKYMNYIEACDKLLQEEE